MTFTPRSEPVSVVQLADALTALGLYGGAGTIAEHTMEAARLGGDGPYRMRLANALLGAAQVEVMLAESCATTAEDLAAAHREQLVTAGVADDPDKLTGFLRSQARAWPTWAAIRGTRCATW
ncbi:DUF6245 family protein [Streptosporangium sp. NPDC002544]|uniref:DUF6245 family protein n=1 Tax=Streptosporangium sp. NPDC002544 TaxID=3154538 RepID=UPI00331664B9